MTNIEARLAEVRERGLMHGAHADWDEGMCATEAAAYIAGEPFSDHPQCVCPVVACFVRSWNDSLPGADRNRLLIPLLPIIVGTRDSDTTAARRSWIAMDWLVRVHTPTWMALSADLREHAAALRALAEIDSGDRLVESRPVIDAAGDVAWDAWDAAGAVAWDAWDAAGDAAGAAARAAWAAAGDAAWDAAGDAAWAAWNAAGAAAGAAARAAARAALQPTVGELQESAVDLVRRMCATTEEST